jgi:hypothetical protein
MKAKLIKHTDGTYILSHNPSGWCIGSTDYEYISKHKGEQIVSKLSKQNCDELFGVVDVEKLAEKEYLDGYENTKICRIAFKDGFNKAMELMKDKLTWFKQPTEIDVVIELEDDFNQCDGCKSGHDVNDFGMHVYPNSTKAYMVCQKAKYKKPKLDSNSCLILKRKQ